MIGEDTKEMLECDLKLEMAAIPDLRDALLMQGLFVITFPYVPGYTGR